MKGKYDKIRSKYISKYENSKNIHERLDRIQERFPGKTWFLQNKPEHTKLTTITQLASAKTATPLKSTMTL